MAKDKKGFLLYCDQGETFLKLKDAQAGKLIKHIFRYVTDEHPDAPDNLTDLLFGPIKMQLKRDLVKYEELKVKRAEYGKKGGEKSGEIRSKTKQNEAKASINEAKRSVIDSVTDIGTVTGTVKEINEVNKDLGEKKFFINGATQYVSVSEYQKKNFWPFIEQWVMKSPGTKDANAKFLLDVFEAIDTKYLAHSFTDEMHVKNAFTSMWEKLLKSQKTQNNGTKNKQPTHPSGGFGKL